MKKPVVLGCAALALGGLVLLGVAGASSYNRLIGLEESVDEAWSQVENVYQRRSDLIPNLVATVKGAAAFEQETFTAVTEARARAGQMSFEEAPSPEQLQRYQEAQGELSAALSRLMVVVERYPELRATEAFRDLQSQLEGTENRIAVERRRFNEVARDFNTTRRRFPTNLLANLFGFEGKAYFEAEDEAEEPPQVDFSDPP
ncbi:MAG TPA: LemA family protein [Thermoanaerobaculia bacterium]|nr:LemA family protein [Thermoanaerobaculia bacterium]